MYLNFNIVHKNWICSAQYLLFWCCFAVILKEIRKIINTIKWNASFLKLGQSGVCSGIDLDRELILFFHTKCLILIQNWAMSSLHNLFVWILWLLTNNFIVILTRSVPKYISIVPAHFSYTFKNLSLTAQSYCFHIQRIVLNFDVLNFDASIRNNFSTQGCIF